jgi:hypothetical protein
MCRIQLAQASLEGNLEHRNEISGTTKGKEILDQLRYSWVLKKDSEILRKGVSSRSQYA